MPKITDIIEIAEAMRDCPVFVVRERCSAVRHRQAKCRLCVEACPEGAITVGGNKVEIDFSLCVACGACTSVCPTEALVSLAPTDDDLACAVASAVGQAGMAVIACARKASHREADPAKFAEVPCLARLDESLLVRLAAHGVSDIVAVDGTCKTCKYRATRPVIEETIDQANEILSVQGSAVRVVRASEFPEEVRASDAFDMYGSSRRGFFGQATEAARDAAGKTVEHVLKADKARNVPALKELLATTEAGTLPQFDAVRHGNLINAMAELGEPAEPELFTRRFGMIEIDREKCNSCAMCTVFCPTHALAKSEEAPTEQGGVMLEFSAMACVQCRLCADICMRKCLTVEPMVPTDVLFDFEPIMFDLPRPAKGLSHFACR